MTTRPDFEYAVHPIERLAHEHEATDDQYADLYDLLVEAASEPSTVTAIDTDRREEEAA